MSSKKIGHYEAKQLSTQIADKAFEHLYTPLNEALKAEGQKAYDRVLSDAGLTYSNISNLESIGVINKTTYCNLTVSFLDNEDEKPYDKNIVTLGDRGYDLPEIFVCHQLRVPKEVSENLMLAFAKLEPVAKARDEFQTRIKQDIVGKTYARVLKTWPEIAPFVSDEYKLPNNNMVVPFSDLIQKYLSPLMALPAPATV